MTNNLHSLKNLEPEKPWTWKTLKTSKTWKTSNLKNLDSMKNIERSTNEWSFHVIKVWATLCLYNISRPISFLIVLLLHIFIFATQKSIIIKRYVLSKMKNCISYKCVYSNTIWTSQHDLYLVYEETMFLGKRQSKCKCYVSVINLQENRK